eukprot:3162356-Prymnesium_polylepis.1
MTVHSFKCLADDRSVTPVYFFVRWLRTEKEPLRPSFVGQIRIWLRGADPDRADAHRSGSLDNERLQQRPPRLRICGGHRRVQVRRPP